MSDDERAVWLSVGLAALFLGLGILIRLGRARAWQRLYWNTRLPAYYRNAWLTFLPIGIIIAVAVIGVVLDHFGMIPWGASLALAAGIAFITVVPIFMVHPPRWLKPRWLLELEAEIARDPSQRQSLIPQVEQSMSSRDYKIAVALFLAALIAWFVFSWPPAVLLGIGVGGILLFAQWSRRGANPPR